MKRLWLRALLWALSCAVLGAVFMAYQSPHMMVDVAARIWSCF